jgi:hypothetical protein
VFIKPNHKPNLAIHVEITLFVKDFVNVVVVGTVMLVV